MVPPSNKAQSTLIGQLAHSVVIDQPLPMHVGNVDFHFTWVCKWAGQISH